MKKMKVFALITIFMLMLTSCSKEETGQLTVYSFGGENEQFSISNGVVVLNGTEEIFDGGDLKTTDKFFTNIKAYSTTFYVLSSTKKKIILSNSVEDMTGGTINPPCDLGKVSGDGIIISAKIDDTNDLKNNLYFELVTIDNEEKESIYQLQMSLSEVTKSDAD